LLLANFILFNGKSLKAHATFHLVYSACFVSPFSTTQHKFLCSHCTHSGYIYHNIEESLFDSADSILSLRYSTFLRLFDKKRPFMKMNKYWLIKVEIPLIICCRDIKYLMIHSSGSQKSLSVETAPWVPYFQIYLHVSLLYCLLPNVSVISRKLIGIPPHYS
jgi:hypothetical protein